MPAGAAVRRYPAKPYRTTPRNLARAVARPGAAAGPRCAPERPRHRPARSAVPAQQARPAPRAAGAAARGPGATARRRLRAGSARPTAADTSRVPAARRRGPRADAARATGSADRPPVPAPAAPPAGTGLAVPAGLANSCGALLPGIFVAMYAGSNTAVSSCRRKPVSSRLAREHPFEQRHWTPACAGVTKIESPMRSLRWPARHGNVDGQSAAATSG